MIWCMHVEELGCMTCLFFCTVGVQLASNILQCPICHSTPELYTNFQQKSDTFTIMGRNMSVTYTIIFTILHNIWNDKHFYRFSFGYIIDIIFLSTNNNLSWVTYVLI